jgi:hypothetical protein
MLSDDWPNPLLASINEPSFVIPTVSIRDCFTGFFVGTKMEFMGLSDISFPTCWLYKMGLIPNLSKSSFGPMPLRINNWGLAIAPVEMIISLAAVFWLR